MSTVLDSIIEGVLEDLQARRVSDAELLEQIDAAPKVRDAYAALAKPGTQIIAEVKRASPSKGPLADIADPASLAREYEKAGAAIISVLTEARRFSGSVADLKSVRNSVSLPVLRKDFIVTEYQVQETRAIGSDLMLLIVAALDDHQLRDYQALAHELGMSVLVEVHDQVELERAVASGAKIIGVNARNLKTLDINEGAFAELLPQIPEGIIKVAESGISSREQVALAESLGAKAILVGETLVRAGNPAQAIITLLGR
jgi:indole-3-glycerol phosphate synthase